MILGSTGCWADANTFASQLLVRRNLYKFDHNKDLEVNACAQLVSVMLYAKRFFPYYVGTILVSYAATNLKVLRIEIGTLTSSSTGWTGRKRQRDLV